MLIHVKNERTPLAKMAAASLIRRGMTAEKNQGKIRLAESMNELMIMGARTVTTVILHLDHPHD